MSEFKHTPGPWAYAPYTKRSFGLGQAGDCALYMVKCEYGDTTIDICRADVRLMAAAPDLLEALQEAEIVDDLHRKMKRIEQRRSKGPNGIAVDDDEDALEWQKTVNEASALISKRNKAIAKATGKQS